MTTKHSPLRVLQGQADQIAKLLKQAGRGDLIAHDPGGKIKAARQTPQVTFGVVMDDKLLKITMSWKEIEGHTEAGISAFVLKAMKEERGRAH